MSLTLTLTLSLTRTRTRTRTRTLTLTLTLTRYVAEYVTCSSCKSPATALQKQNRLFFMQVQPMLHSATYTTWPHITRTLTRTPHPHHPRLFSMQCNNCGARRSVQPIKTGFVAIGKGARKKNRTG